MDDDLQHRPEEIPALLGPLDDPDGRPRLRHCGRGGARLRSVALVAVGEGRLAMAGVPNARDVSAFRAFRTDLRDAFAHVTDPFVSLDVILSWATSSVARCQCAWTPRSGRSGYTVLGLVKHALNMATGYSVLPLRLVIWLGFLLPARSAACSSRARALLAGADPGRRFHDHVAMLSAFSGALMLSLGIIGEYLGRLHFRSMQRPTYLVRVDSHHDAPPAGIPRQPRLSPSPNPVRPPASAIAGHWLHAVRTRRQDAADPLHAPQLAGNEGRDVQQVLARRCGTETALSPGAPPIGWSSGRGHQWPPDPLVHSRP